MSDVIYFELNNWMPDYNYPFEEPFISWLGNDLNLYFLNDKWVFDNKLCVNASVIDMSVNFCITAKLEWVKENCSSLLDKNKRFIIEPNKYGEVYGKFGCPFCEYKDENIGVHWVYEEDS